MTILCYSFGLRAFAPLALVLLLGLQTDASAQPSRIHPEGIEGALILCGRGEVVPSVREKFFELAGKERAKIIVLDLGPQESAQPWIARLAQEAEKQNARLQTLRLEALGEPAPEARTACEQATALWLVGAAPADGSGEASIRVQKICHQLLRRKGVIGACGAASEIVASTPLSGNHRLALLPDSLIEARMMTAPSLLSRRARTSQGNVGYRLEPEAALLVQGRTLQALGTGKIFLHHAATPTLPERSIELEKLHPQDLTALRRHARDRMAGFPPLKVESPSVPRGALFIVGGGGMPDGLLKQFVERAGGRDRARIVIFPTAHPKPLPKREVLAEAFRKAGAKKITVLDGQARDEVESKEFLDTLRDATGLWFDGGRQWRYVDCYEGTQALPLMLDVLQRGGVIGGTSAGATIQGDYLCRGGIFTNFDICYPGYERGLGFLKGVAIDQHFSQRRRQSDMTALLKIYPQYLGIGLDEATAIVVQGSRAEVLGRGKAHFYDAQREVLPGQPDHEALSAGAHYDLHTRKVLPPPER